MIYIFLLVLCLGIAYYVYNNVLRKQMLQNLSDRYILITGCDSGFGNYLAKRLDRLGVPVFAGCLTNISASKLNEQSSSRLRAFTLDVTNEDHIEAAVKFVESNLPADKGLWGLVNNAGINILEAPLEIWTKRHMVDTLAVNLFGPVSMTKAFLPLLRKTKGRIVHVSSVNAITAFTCRFAYNISKVSLESFSECICREMYHVGITSHTVQPGAFATQICKKDVMSSNLQTAFNNSSEEVKRFYGTKWLEVMKEAPFSIPKNPSTDLSQVTYSIIHALFSVRPKHTYLSGKDAYTTWYPLSIAPRWFSDWYFAMPAPDAVIRTR